MKMLRSRAACRDRSGRGGSVTLAGCHLIDLSVRELPASVEVVSRTSSRWDVPVAASRVATRRPICPVEPVTAISVVRVMVVSVVSGMACAGSGRAADRAGISVWLRSSDGWDLRMP